jgi:MYXO-CTERM domain-containing protein
MNRLSQLIVASQFVILATPAFANPYAREVLRAREVAGPNGPSNVQLTYGVDGGHPQTPTDVVTFGNKSTPWKAPATSYNTNTGSGLRWVDPIQMCDCGVAIGQSLEYKITVESAYSAGKSLTLTARLTTSGNHETGTAPSSSIDASYDAGSAPDVLPWEIPDPVEIQGIDCTVECTAVGPQGTGGAPGAGGTQETGGAPGAGGTQETGGAPGAGGTQETGGAPGTGGATVPATTEPSQQGGGSCSMVQGGHPAGLFLLVLGVGLALFGRRKRGS